MSQPNFAENYLKYVLASESIFWKTINKHPSDLRADWKMFASFFRSGHQIFKGTFSGGHFFLCPNQIQNRSTGPGCILQIVQFYFNAAHRPLQIIL